MTDIAVIGGSGLGSLPGLEVLSESDTASSWGEVSHPVIEGLLGGESLLFMPRHGRPHKLPPHKINYRANLWKLKQQGARCVIGLNAVGGLDPDLQLGALVIPDQLIDYTWGREHTYYDGSADALEHVDFTGPYTQSLRQSLLAAFAGECVDGGTYAATQGPRLETAAEVRKLQADGGTVVGMTGMPEAGLARELGLAYAALCIVVNPGAGLSTAPITLEAIAQVLDEAAVKISEGLQRLLEAT